MEILLVLAGVLLGILGTIGFQVARVWYLDWRRARDWAVAGRRWMEIMNVLNSRKGYPNTQTAEERLADLQRRVHMIIIGEPIDDFDEQLAYIKDHPERLPEYELEEHRERLAEKEEGAFVSNPFHPGDDIAKYVETHAPDRTKAVESYSKVMKKMKDLSQD